MVENIINSTMMKKFKQALLSILCFAMMTAASAQSDSYKKTIQTSGDYIQVGLPLAALAFSGIKKDKAGLKQFAYGFGTTFLVTHGLKRTIRKKRPDPSEAYNAFPSGHTSVAFHAAAHIQKRYGWKYGLPVYVLSSFTGYSRVEGIVKKHDYWDVFAGATLGMVSAYLFTKKANPEDISISVQTGNNNIILALGITLN